MNILIAGGSGFIGSYLRKRMEDMNYNVRVISRSYGDIPWQMDDLVDALKATDVLINLAGKSINTRFSGKNKKQILNSRIHTTQLLNNALLNCNIRPELWINASAAGIYKHTYQNEALNELSEEYADDFLGDVVQKWEKTFFVNSIPAVRKVAIRTSVVLGREGGAFPRFKLLASSGLGGKQGDGKQMVSWIHLEDYFRIILFLINNEDLTGVINAVAPNPMSNNQFMKTLRQIVKMPFGITTPTWMLKIMSYIIGIDASLLLDSTHIYSEVLRLKGFEFGFPTVEKAFQDLTKK